MPAFIDLTGNRYGRLVVLERATSRRNRTRWWCGCNCGKEVIVNFGELRQGKTRSCGCLRREVTSINKTIHGDARKGKKTRLFQIWQAMTKRCRTSSDTTYKWYGGRGIKVCGRWQKYENFKKDMYREYLIHCIRYGRRETTLDRIDSNGNYFPGNCRWATWKVQRNNRRE